VEVTLDKKPIPTSVEATRFDGYRQAGLPRIARRAGAGRARWKRWGACIRREALDAVAIARTLHGIRSN